MVVHTSGCAPSLLYFLLYGVDALPTVLFTGVTVLFRKRRREGSSMPDISPDQLAYETKLHAQDVQRMVQRDKRAEAKAGVSSEHSDPGTALLCTCCGHSADSHRDLSSCSHRGRWRRRCLCIGYTVVDPAGRS